MYFDFTDRWFYKLNKPSAKKKWVALGTDAFLSQLLRNLWDLKHIISPARSLLRSIETGCEIPKEVLVFSEKENSTKLLFCVYAIITLEGLGINSNYLQETLVAAAIKITAHISDKDYHLHASPMIDILHKFDAEFFATSAQTYFDSWIEFASNSEDKYENLKKVFVPKIKSAMYTKSIHVNMVIKTLQSKPDLAEYLASKAKLEDIIAVSHFFPTDLLSKYFGELATEMKLQNDLGL